MTTAELIDPQSLIDPETGQPAVGAPLGAVLSAHAALTPDRPAVTFGARTISFAELDGLANRRARQLEQLGIGQDDRVIVSMPNSPEFIECTFAVWKLGAIVCPVSHRLTREEFAAIVGLAKPAAVLSDEANGPPNVHQIVINGPPPEHLSAAPLPPRSARPGRILSSGGSTGRPKLVVDPYASAWGPEKAGYRRWPRCTLSIASPFYHAGPNATVLFGLSQGSHVVGMERFDPEEWLSAIERHAVDYVYTVPTIMTRISKLDPGLVEKVDLSSVRILLHMAAACPPATKRWWIDLLGPEGVLELYGGAERLGLTLIDGVEWLAHPGSVGRASAGDEIVITDEQDNALPAGEIGEVNFRKQAGPGTTYSYIGAATRIRGDLDSYGDMGWLDTDGYLYIADRRTDMVLVGGVNVYPAEVEKVIDSLAGVLCSAVIGLPDPDLGNRLHAIVELQAGFEPPGEQAFLSGLHGRLVGFKRPRSVEFTHERIRDDAGKVRRSALRDARLGKVDRVEKRKGETMLSLENIFALAEREVGAYGLADEGLVARVRAVVEWINGFGPYSRSELREIQEQVRRLLANRLKLAFDRQRFPQIAEERIERPIFVVGFARSGTTLIHSLLAEDPAALAPQSWHMYSPSPPPGAGPVVPERIAFAQRQIEAWMDFCPAQKPMHPYIDKGAFQLIEDEELIALDFRTTYCYHYWKVPHDMILWGDLDPIATFDFQRQFMQHFQWNAGPRHWVCKGTLHQRNLRTLFDFYPDALCIWAHRPVSEILSSISLLGAVIYDTISGRCGDLKDTGKSNAELMKAGLDQILDDEMIDDPRLIHIPFREIVAAPTAVIRDIYARQGREVTPEFEGRIESWLAAPENQVDRYGRYPYSYEALGLEREWIDELFADYSRRFGLD